MKTKFPKNRLFHTTTNLLPKTPKQVRFGVEISLVGVKTKVSCKSDLFSHLFFSDGRTEKTFGTENSNVNVERGNAADKLSGRNIIVSFQNNSDVPIEVMILIFYSD